MGSAHACFVLFGPTGGAFAPVPQPVPFKKAPVSFLFVIILSSFFTEHSLSVPVVYFIKALAFRIRIDYSVSNEIVLLPGPRFLNRFRHLVFSAFPVFHKGGTIL